MRRLLFFLCGVALGVSLLIMLSAGTGAGAPFGIAFCALLVVGTAIGGRWGRGPVARGVQAPYLARAGIAVVVLCALMVGMLIWKPFLGDGLPMGWFLACIAASGLLMVPVGLMGRKPKG
ncbi:hypothetical protein Axi01nite_47220 [Actinoplanes xinjiangensis]|nr:hypothetical protein Axi01nite_47220 [Actinoplanes xinjiangensis]